MSEAIITAVISGGLALAGVILTTISGNRKVENQIKINQATTEVKIEELTREVREHNEFGRRIPLVESQITDITRRVERLENKA